MPHVSVCIPTYEPNATYLQEAIECVFAQTYTDWELVVHDDGSKADVRAMMEKFLKDPRVRFVRSTERLGIGGNWNATAALANAPVIAYLFQDDLWAPRYLERALAAFTAHQTARMVALQHRYLLQMHNDMTDSYRPIAEMRQKIFEQRFAKGSVFLSSWILRGLHPNLVGEPDFVVIQKSLLDDIHGWDSAMKQCLDVEGWTRMLQHGDIAFVPEESGSFRIHGEATTAKNHRDGKGLTDRLRILVRLTLHGHGSAILAIVRELPGMVKKAMRRLAHR